MTRSFLCSHSEPKNRMACLLEPVSINVLRKTRLKQHKMKGSLAKNHLRRHVSSFQKWKLVPLFIVFFTSLSGVFLQLAFLQLIQPPAEELLLHVWPPFLRPPFLRFLFLWKIYLPVDELAYNGVTYLASSFSYLFHES